MNKNKLSSYFIFLSVLTFLTVFFSIVYKSYFSLTKPQKMVENNVLLKEFNPNLDLTVLSTIESKDKNTDENFDFSIIKTAESSTITPTPQPIITPITTPVATTSSQPLIEPTP